MQGILHAMNTDHPIQCPACNKHLKTTQGLLVHLLSAQKCAWYKMRKLSELKVSGAQMGVDVIDNQEEEVQWPISTGWFRHHKKDASGVLSDFNERAFNLIPLETYFSDDAEPGPSHHSGDGDSISGTDVDEHVEEDPFPTAECIISKRSIQTQIAQSHAYSDKHLDCITYMNTNS